MGAQVEYGKLAFRQIRQEDMPSSRRPSSPLHQLIDDLLRLDDGEALEVDLPPGVTAMHFRDNLMAICRRRKVKVCSKTKDNKLYVWVKVESFR